jgi:hypothetical protein
MHVAVSVAAEKGPVMGASKGAGSTRKAWGGLMEGFPGIFLSELHHGPSAGYAKNTGNRAFIV